MPEPVEIYIASSWRNQHAVEMLTEQLENLGCVVHSFVRQAEADEGRANFGDVGIAKWIGSEAGRRKFAWDLRAATQSDLVIYIGPSGQDAWAEVGAAWASGVPVLGLWAKGEEIGLMRRMVSFWHHDYRMLLNHVRDWLDGMEMINFSGIESVQEGT